MHKLIAPILASAGLLHASHDLPPGAEMSYLENAHIRLGVDLSRGGAIVYLAKQGGPNLINNFDNGRQVQMSFYSGPVPYHAEGQQPAPHWQHLGWNPVQAGDDFHHGSKVTLHEKQGPQLHLQCIPLQWPLNAVPGDCMLESWLTLEENKVLARAKLINKRQDRKQYAARLQELPAVYVNSALHHLHSYTGSHPFEQAPLSPLPEAKGQHPWAFWFGTEGWCAAVDATGSGLGLITPGRIHFTGGLAGKPGSLDTLATSTSYLASQELAVLDHNIEYEYSYELLLGSIAEIRARAQQLRPKGLPSWDFNKDRQGWTYTHAGDTGWPIQQCLQVQLTGKDPQLNSPYTWWLAEAAPFVEVEAAFHTAQKEATLFWQCWGEAAAQHSLSFPIQGDGQQRVYRIRLADSAQYRGPMLRLRLDPVAEGRAGDKVEVYSIKLLAQ